MRQFALLFFLLASAFGQHSQVPYAPDSDGPGPTFTNEQFHYSYPGSFSSIRKVDFRNFRFLGLDNAGKPSERFSLRNGHYKHDEPLDHQSIDLGSIHYLSKSSASNGDSVLVLLSWFAAGGSSSQGGMARVFTLSGSHLRAAQEIDWDTHFEGSQPTESFDSSTNTLVVRSSHYIPGDGHCCISAVDVVTFRWDGTRFVQSGLQAELSEYGKKAGKVLPKTPPRLPD
jgi:hypothetical protein